MPEQEERTELLSIDKKDLSPLDTQSDLLRPAKKRRTKSDTAKETGEVADAVMEVKGQSQQSVMEVPAQGSADAQGRLTLSLPSPVRQQEHATQEEDPTQVEPSTQETQQEDPTQVQKWRSTQTSAEDKAAQAEKRRLRQEKRAAQKRLLDKHPGF